MLLDFTMEKCTQIQMNEERVGMYKAYLLEELNLTQDHINSIMSDLLSPFNM